MCESLSAEAGAKKNKVVKRIPVSEQFTHASTTWSIRGKAFDLKYKPTVIDGRIGVCGAVQYGSVSMTSFSSHILKRAYVEYEGKVILRDVRFFTRVKRSANLSKATANCAVTNIKAPKKGFKVFLGWRGGIAS